MSGLLTKTELEGYLYKIRGTLCSYDYTLLKNVIFFNTDAVFEYLCEIPLIGDEGESVGGALDIIGSCIPVSLTDNSLKFLMQSATCPELLAEFEARFSKTNKMDFLQLITQISNSAEWLKLLNLCETIRVFRCSEAEGAKGGRAVSEAVLS